MNACSLIQEGNLLLLHISKWTLYLKSPILRISVKRIITCSDICSITEKWFKLIWISYKIIISLSSPTYITIPYMIYIWHKRTFAIRSYMVYIWTHIYFHSLYDEYDVDSVTQIIFISVGNFHTICVPMRYYKISYACVHLR